MSSRFAYPPGSAGSGYSEVQDEGTALTARTQLNFVGRGVVADDSGSKSRIRVFDPATMAYLVEEFASGTATSGSIGALGWAFTNGTCTVLAGESGRPGIFRFATGTTVNTQVRLFSRATVGTGDFLPADTFDLRFDVRLNTNDTDTLIRIGLMPDPSQNPDTNGIYFEKLAADTNWFQVTRASSVQTRTDTSTAVDTSFHAFRIRRKDASTIGFTLDGGTEGDNTANIPTAGMKPFIHIRNAAAADKTFDIDYFDLLLTGLSRTGG